MVDISEKLNSMTTQGLVQVRVPDIGKFKDVIIIEVMIKVGDVVKAEDSLITIETDKATMDIPSPIFGVVKELKIKLGDKVSEGALLALIEESSEQKTITPQFNLPDNADVSLKQSTPMVSMPNPILVTSFEKSPPESVKAEISASIENTAQKSHASPSIRRFARELGVNLSQVTGSGVKGRVTKEDVQNFVKAALNQPRSSAGLQISDMPIIDFSQFGAVENKPLSRIKKLTGAFLHRNWVSIPHITQYDEADITEMEIFRKQLGAEYIDQGIKITPLAFLLKAVVEALKKFPDFNASLDVSGEFLILKKYFNIGVAVDTADGLVVPVLRDINQKSIVQLAKELGEISTKAREKKISAAEMQGGCFTISSLGGIGGTAFSPIINAPEVAILGVSKSSTKPVWIDGKFEPRLILPFSLSYDHRVIDGAAGVRFTTYLAQVISDAHKLML